MKQERPRERQIRELSELRRRRLVRALAEVLAEMDEQQTDIAREREVNR